jgi:hypothetical protein
MEILQDIGSALDWLRDHALVLAAGAGVIVLGIAIYVIRSVGSVFVPLARSVKWLFGLPDDVTAGMAQGVRVLIWAVIVAAILWAIIGGQS